MIKCRLKYIFAIVLCLGLAACAHTYTKNKQRKKQTVTTTTTSQPAWKATKLVHFNKIDIKGPFQLHVMGVDEPQDSIVYPTNQDVTFYVKNQTLFIYPSRQSKHHNAKQHKNLETIKLLSTDLQAVHLTNWSTATLENIHSRKGLTIIDESHGDLTLHGKIILKRLEKHTPGRIYIDWVDSDCLTIHATQGDIMLAGIAKQLYARLSGNVRADLKYLRAYRTWIHTHQHSHAAILALQSLNGFADGYSLIDYYKRPQQLALDTREHGRIMQVGAWR